jgi:hypothetical protein
MPAKPKRMDSPATAKSRADSFTSGGAISMPFSRACAM